MHSACAILYRHWPAWLYHLIISQTGRFAEKKVTEHKNYVLIFSTALARNISHSRKNSEECYQKCTYVSLHVKCQLFLSHFNHTAVSLTDFRKILKYQISWKSDEWERNCSMRTDRRMDRHDEAISCFSWLYELALPEVALCNWHTAVQLFDTTVERVPTPHTNH